MTFLLLLPAITCELLFAAHWLRAGHEVLAWACAAAPLLLVARHALALRVTQILLILAAAEWVRTALFITTLRMQAGAAWQRAAGILLAVALLNLVAVWLCDRAWRRRRAQKQKGTTA
jgi:hypothetical protein